MSAATLHRAIISTISQDRPGLVTELTALVQDQGLSVEDSRMAVLGGDFAVIMAIAGAKANLDNLAAALASYCQDQEIEALFRHTTSRTKVQAMPYWVSVKAMDHPGIVASVATFFSERGINILELETDAQPAPHTGTPMFNLSMTVAVPPNSPIAQLRQAFETFCGDEDLDGEIEAAG